MRNREIVDFAFNPWEEREIVDFAFNPWEEREIVDFAFNQWENRAENFRMVDIGIKA